MIFAAGFGLALALTSVIAQPLDKRTVSNTDSSLTLIYQNNLNSSDDVNHVGAILLEPMAASKANAACAGIHEQLISKNTLQTHMQDFEKALAYIAYAGRAKPSQAYQIEGGVVISGPDDQISFESSQNAILPVLCTQSSKASQPVNSTATTSNQITVAAAGNEYLGYRNQKSFRFLGIRYADPPARFEYSQIYSKTGLIANATTYGSECTQGTSGSEDCLFLNIQTPYIPKAGGTNDLRPVYFYIHGGGFTSGSGADPSTDGGNMASREDIVSVQINYRLSTLGFLAVPGTEIKGNFGIGDQIIALEWIVKNIEKFGGDPGRITINGDSAGAGSTRTLLGSPLAIGKFQGAMSMSNLGGGVDLGLTSNYGTTYSSYLTIAESYKEGALPLLNATNCTAGTVDSQIACLRALNVTLIDGASNVPRYVVQDGTIVNTEDLDVYNRNGSAAYVPVMFGTCANDGGAFSVYPTTPVLNESAGLQIGLGVNASFAQAIIDSGLFPYYDTGNITLDSFNVTQRVATDNTFRCIDQATMYAGAVSGAFPATYLYQSDRTWGGYNPNNVPDGLFPAPGYPFGDPNAPYFRLHSSDFPYAWGNVDVIRDPNDLYAIQLVSGYFAEFVKSGQPNPSVEYLKIRGYTKSLEAVQNGKPWEKVSSATGPVRHFDYPSFSTEFEDLEQCAFLNYTISYYLDGGMR